MPDTPRIDHHLTPEDLAATMRTDVRAGLTASPKELSPKYFYDGRGSELFEEITKLPEYYPFRAERGLLAEHAHEIAGITRAETLVELGSGSSEKTHLLLRALRSAGSLERYVPVDVSVDAIQWAMPGLVETYPDLEVHGAVADFERHLHLLPAAGSRLVAFLGGTIGNFFPEQRRDFLSAIRGTMAPEDALLLGTDLVKDERQLVLAYDDAAGVTADFNLNVLRVINARLDADLDVDAFEHLARWDPAEERIEMRLRSRREQRASIRALDLEVAFADGEEMRTEISSKFTRARVEMELAQAGLRLAGWFTDDDYALSLARPEPGAGPAGQRS